VNATGDDGAAALAAALKDNHTLTTLDVDGEYD
jgi:predicted O-methyltransferase YrrM